MSRFREKLARYRARRKEKNMTDFSKTICFICKQPIESKDFHLLDDDKNKAVRFIGKGVAHLRHKGIRRVYLDWVPPRKKEV